MKKPTIKDRPLAIEYVAIDHLRPDPGNPRRIEDADLEALTGSIRTNGFVQPVLVDRATGTVIGGHQRLIAARRLGMTEVPVTYIETTPTERRILNVALNNIHGDWDDQLLARMLLDIRSDPTADLRHTGFDDTEVDKLLRMLSANEKGDRPETFDLEAALKGPDRRLEPGELWRLGDHRLLVGDATLREDHARVLGGRTARMCFTDPPYNVGLGEHGGQGRDQRKRPILNDALDPAARAAFVTAFVRPILDACDGAIYICMSGKELPELSRILAVEGGQWSTYIIWSKERFTLGRADYQRGYEPLWYGWRKGAKPHWCGDRDQSDVWTIPRPQRSPLHATTKPLELMERALRNSSDVGDLVLDPFAGSGSTLIAAERTGRVCAAIEIDPRHAAVIVDRWEHFTGEKAVRSDE